MVPDTTAPCALLFLLCNQNGNNLPLRNYNIPGSPECLFPPNRFGRLGEIIYAISWDVYRILVLLLLLYLPYHSPPKHFFLLQFVPVYRLQLLGHQ